MITFLFEGVFHKHMVGQLVTLHQTGEWSQVQHGQVPPQPTSAGAEY